MPDGAAEEDGVPVVALVVTFVGSSAIEVVYLCDEGINEVHASAACLIGAALGEILFIAKTLAQLVIFLLGHPLQQRLVMAPCRMRLQRPEMLRQRLLLREGGGP